VPLAAHQRSADITAELAAFRQEGQATRVSLRDGLPVFENAFWTARQRQGHPLHEVSYRGCFKPQLPAFFIERLSRPGETVLDPFMGRGTTPLQAALMGRAAVGADINPLGAMLVRPRLNPPSLEAITERLETINWRRRLKAPAELLVFYHPKTLAELCALRAHLLDRPVLDAVDDWIRMVAVGRLTGHSPGFFSVYSLPPNQAASAAGQARINARLDQTPPRRSVPELILKKSRDLLKAGGPQSGDHRLLTGSAEALDIPDGSVDLVVTSPPFLDVVQYARDNWLRCWFVGVKAERVEIAMHRGLGNWSAFIGRSLAELGRVVRPGGHIAFEVGEVRKGAVELDRLVVAALAGLPFEPLGVAVNRQAFTKTAQVWGIGNNRVGTNSNRIVLARRL
jgi:hypothetical protein